MELAVSLSPSLRYVVDPLDPRAPPSDVWNKLTPEQRHQVVLALPSEFEMSVPPEGDRHLHSKISAMDTLGRHFQRIGRRVYVSGELPIYYPGERVFSADLIAVLDVEIRERDSWVVDVEGKGIDFAMEIHVRGDRRKDLKKNVEKYAGLGIPEYFAFDRARGDLFGFRLPTAKARTYERIASKEGSFESHVLGVELTLVGNKVRFAVGGAVVPEVDELLTRLGTALDNVMASKSDAEHRAEELERALEEEQKLREDEQKRREELERELATSKAEIERLRGGR